MSFCDFTADQNDMGKALEELDATDKSNSEYCWGKEIPIKAGLLWDFWSQICIQNITLNSKF